MESQSLINEPWYGEGPQAAGRAKDAQETKAKRPRPGEGVLPLEDPICDGEMDANKKLGACRNAKHVIRSQRRLPVVLLRGPWGIHTRHCCMDAMRPSQSSGSRWELR